MITMYFAPPASLKDKLLVNCFLLIPFPILFISSKINMYLKKAIYIL